MIFKCDGFFKRFEKKGMPCDAWNVKGGCDTPCADNQIIVMKRCDVRLNPAVLPINAPRVRQEKSNIGGFPEDAAHRIGNVLRVKLCRRHLIEERQKRMIIVSIHDGHIDRLIRQRSGCP